MRKILLLMALLLVLSPLTVCAAEAPVEVFEDDVVLIDITDEEAQSTNQPKPPDLSIDQREQAISLDDQTVREMSEAINRYRSPVIEAAQVPSESSEFSVDNRIARLKRFYDLTVEYDESCKDALPTTLYYLESTCATLGTDFFTKMQPIFDSFGVTKFYLKFHPVTDEGGEDYYGYTEYTMAGELSVHIFTGGLKEANYFVIVHELGHVLNIAVGEDNAALVALNGKYDREMDTEQYVSRYARYDDNEDFAETFRILMFSPPQPNLPDGMLKDKYMLMYSQLMNLYGQDSNVVRRVQYFLGM